MTVTAWTSDELTRLEPIDELGLASRRPDGSLRRFVTIWFVRLGDDLYVRSAYGYDNPWFQRALASGDGRIRVRGMERDVTFVATGPEVANDLNAAYHAKYDRHGARIVGTVVSAGGDTVDAQGGSALTSCADVAARSSVTSRPAGGSVS